MSACVCPIARIAVDLCNTSNANRVPTFHVSIKILKLKLFRGRVWRCPFFQQRRGCKSFVRYDRAGADPCWRFVQAGLASGLVVAGEEGQSAPDGKARDIIRQLCGIEDSTIHEAIILFAALDANIGVNRRVVVA